METNEEKLVRFITAVQWAQVLENRKQLTEELKLFIDVIEYRATKLNEESNDKVNSPNQKILTIAKVNV